MTINLGNFIQVDGQTRSSGIASGLDVETIVNSLVEARSIPIQTIEDNITLGSDKTAAYGTLQTKLNTLLNSVNFLRNPPGFNTASSNAFEFRNVNLSSSLTTPSSYVNITADAGTAIGNYDLSIGSLARGKIDRTGSYQSASSSVTEAASGTTAGLFSAGTFQLTSTQLVTAATDALAATDFTATGSPAGIVSAVDNFVLTGDAGDKNFIGAVSGFAATVDGANVDISVTINGSVYTANDVVANAGGDSQSIADGTVITLTNAQTGTAFDLTIAGDYNINANQVNADAFAGALDTALAAVSIRQTRTVTNYNSSFANDTLLEGLRAQDIRLTSNAFDPTTGEAGQIGRINVTAVTGPGNADGEIEVYIGGERFRATGLGGGGSDTQTANITLTNDGGDKTFELAINDAGVVFDFSTASTASELEAALNDQLGTNGVEITINEGDSLADIASIINAQQSKTGVTGTIVQVSDNDFRLSLRSNFEGTSRAFSAIDPSGVLSEVGFSTIQAATDAVLTIDGVEITRSSNVIDDVIDGITFNLSQVTPDYGLISASTITASVSNDTATTEATITNFINAYNDFRIFVQEQTTRDEDGNYAEGAVLGSETSFRTLVQQISNRISEAVSGADNGYDSLGSIGIQITDFEGDAENDEVSNILDIPDISRLQNLLAGNFDDIRQVFEYQMNSDSSNLAVFKRSNNSTLTDFKINIDTGRAAGEEVEIRDTDGTFLFYATLSGSSIVGIEGTSLEGTTFLYTGDGADDTINVNISYGLADRLYNSINTILDDDGIIANEIDFFADERTRLEEEIDDLNERISSYQDRLYRQYSALEAAITKVNTLLSFLDAQSQSLYGND